MLMQLQLMTIIYFILCILYFVALLVHCVFQTCSRSIEFYKDHSSTDVYLVIPTMEKYAIARAKLHESLVVSGWDMSRILWVFAGELENRIDASVDGSITIRTSRNLYEYIAFLGPLLFPEVHDVLKDNIFLLLHDTSIVYRDFLTNVNTRAEEFGNKKMDVYWLGSGGQCNICMFNMNASKLLTRVYFGLETLDKQRAILMEHEFSDPLSPKNESIQYVQSFVHESLFQYYNGVHDAYNSGLTRTNIYYPSLDMSKWVFMVASTDIHPDAP